MSLPHSSSNQIVRLFSYWTDLRNGGSVPTLADLDPAHVTDLLPNIWMAGWQDDAEDFVYRIAGDAILSANARPMHRRSLQEIYPAGLASLLRERYTRLCAEPCVYHSVGTIYTLIGRYGLGERLVLPLLDRDGQTPVVLGCCDYRIVVTSAGARTPDIRPSNTEICRYLTLDGDVISSETRNIEQTRGSSARASR